MEGSTAPTTAAVGAAERSRVHEDVGGIPDFFGGGSDFFDRTYPEEIAISCNMNKVHNELLYQIMFYFCDMV